MNVPNRIVSGLMVDATGKSPDRRAKNHTSLAPVICGSKVVFYCCLILAVVFGSSVYGQDAPAPIKFRNVDGVTIVIKYTSDSLPAEIFHLDQSGQVIRQDTRIGRDTYAYVNGKKTLHQHYFYDRKALTPVFNETDSCFLDAEDHLSYDTEGRLLHVEEVCEIYIVGKKGFENTYSYDNKGRVSKVQIINHYEHDKAAKSYHYSGDEVRIDFYHKNKKTGIEITRQDNSGRVISQSLRDSRNRLLQQKTYKYDNRGQLCGIKYYDTGKDGFGVQRHGEILDSVSFEYSGSGRLVNEKYYYKKTVEYAYFYLYE